MHGCQAFHAQHPPPCLPKIVSAHVQSWLLRRLDLENSRRTLVALTLEPRHCPKSACLLFCVRGGCQTRDEGCLVYCLKSVRKLGLSVWRHSLLLHRPALCRCLKQQLTPCGDITTAGLQMSSRQQLLHPGLPPHEAKLLPAASLRSSC